MAEHEAHSVYRVAALSLALAALGCSDSDPTVVRTSDAAADRSAEDRFVPDVVVADGAVPDASDGGVTDRDAAEAGADDAGDRRLFNGRDFTGWVTYLGPPYGTSEPVGLDLDPKGVFSVVEIDGAPAIRISGEIWGALTTVEEFENYHLHLEFKWGQGTPWPPLTTRDSGLMYHSVGSFGAVSGGGGGLSEPPGSGYFMRSMELQIAEGDVGSYYSLGPISVESGRFYVLANAQHEKPLGSWNTLDVYVLGAESVHVVNGIPVVRVTGAMLEDSAPRAPLTRGKIQLQSESMEIYFRALTLARIREIPSELR